MGINVFLKMCEAGRETNQKTSSFNYGESRFYKGSIHIFKKETYIIFHFLITFYFVFLLNKITLNIQKYTDTVKSFISIF